MKHSLLTCALLGLCSMSPAMASTSATASIDWSTLSITLFDLDPSDGITPSFSWSAQSTQVLSFASTSSNDSSADWTSALSVLDAPATAWADAGVLHAESTRLASDLTPYGSAEAERTAGFSISAHTLALISVSASYAVSTGAPTDAAFAGADLSTWGPAATGVGVQENFGGIGSYLEQFGLAPDAQSGTVSVTFANLTGALMGGEFSVSVYAGTSVAAVPEPGSYAMFLAGLGLMGLMARQRRR